MEILVALFLGAWLSGAGIWGYLALKKDLEEQGGKKQ